MLCASLNAPSTDAERPAIRHSKLPEALPEESIETLNATCENAVAPWEAAPPPFRCTAVAEVALCAAQAKTVARTTPTATSVRFTASSFRLLEAKLKPFGRRAGDL